jgi:hypothetical protein
MLGDKLGQESGQVIGTRVLAGDVGPRMETTIQIDADGKCRTEVSEWR